MIFLGSKRYPGEAQFEEFLSENGGESNAYTECEYTCTLVAPWPWRPWGPWLWLSWLFLGAELP